MLVGVARYDEPIYWRQDNPIQLGIVKRSAAEVAVIRREWPISGWYENLYSPATPSAAKNDDC